MPSQLTSSHILAQERLRTLLSTAVGTAWSNLPGYDRHNVDEFLAAAVPLVVAGQRRAAALTEVYVATHLGRTPRGVPARVGADLRNGVPPEEVYRRPFVQVWSALKAGTGFLDAVSGAQARAQASVEMDVQLASRAMFQDAQDAYDIEFGYQRVADGGACAFCLEVDGAYVKSADAMPLHNRCGCSLEPLTAPHPRAKFLPSGVAVHEHGELGPVLTAPDQNFTSQSDF